MFFCFGNTELENTVQQQQNNTEENFLKHQEFFGWGFNFGTNIFTGQKMLGHKFSGANISFRGKCFFGTTIFRVNKCWWSMKCFGTTILGVKNRGWGFGVKCLEKSDNKNIFKLFLKIDFIKQFFLI